MILEGFPTLVILGFYSMVLFACYSSEEEDCWMLTLTWGIGGAPVPIVKALCGLGCCWIRGFWMAPALAGAVFALVRVGR